MGKGGVRGKRRKKGRRRKREGDFSLSLSLSPQTWLPRRSAQFRRLTWTQRGHQLDLIHIHVSSWDRLRIEKEGWDRWGELKRLG